MTQTKKCFLSIFIILTMVFAFVGMMNIKHIYAVELPSAYALEESTTISNFHANYIPKFRYYSTTLKNPGKLSCSIYDNSSIKCYYAIKRVTPTNLYTEVDFPSFTPEDYPEGDYVVVVQVSYKIGSTWYNDPRYVTCDLTIKKSKPSITGLKSSRKKVTVTWSPIYNADSYQVQIGSKKYSIVDNEFTSNKLAAGKTYKVKVRAKIDGEYAAWSKTKKLKIKK